MVSRHSLYQRCRYEALTSSARRWKWQVYAKGSGPWQEHKLLSCLGRSCYGKVLALPTSQAGADSLLETVGLRAPAPPSSSCQEGTTGPLPQVQFPSFTASQTLENWQTGIGKGCYGRDPHSSQSLLPRPTASSVRKQMEGSVQDRDTHREVWPILPILSKAQLCTQGIWPFWAEKKSVQKVYKPEYENRAAMTQSKEW